MPMPKGGYRSSDIVTIFELSPVNGARYHGEQLPAQPWAWPRSTWLQRRIELLEEIGVLKPAPSATVAANQRGRADQDEMTLSSRKFKTPRLRHKRRS